MRHTLRAALAAAVLAALFAPPAAAAGSPYATTYLWIALILVAARLAGIVERVGMPAVLGELLVGVLIGNLPAPRLRATRGHSGRSDHRVPGATGRGDPAVPGRARDATCRDRARGWTCTGGGGHRRGRAVSARNLPGRAVAAARPVVQRLPVSRCDADRDLGRDHRPRLQGHGRPAVAGGARRARRRDHRRRNRHRDPRGGVELGHAGQRERRAGRVADPRGAAVPRRRDRARARLARPMARSFARVHPAPA